MIKIISSLLLFLVAGISNAFAAVSYIDSWYPSYSTVQIVNTCSSSWGSCSTAPSTNTSICSGSGSAQFAYHNVNNGNDITQYRYLRCVTIANECPQGQARDISGACVDPPCVSPLVPANTVMDTTQTTCVPPDSKTCSSIGVDVNSFVVKCSEMLDGAPAQCYNSDITPFALQGCPTLTCPDGSTTVYPTPCPVTSCPDGFTLSDVSGIGKTCVMPLPDSAEQNPCVMVDGSNDPLCADPGKNCQLVAGQYVCLKEEVTPPSGATCYNINGTQYCLSNQPTIESEKTVVTNPDGSTTVREITTPSVQGAGPRVKVATYHPDGSITVTSNNPGDLTDLGLQPQPTQKIDLSKVEKNTLDTANNTKGILDTITEFFGGEGSFETTGLDEIQPAIDSNTDAAVTEITNTTNPFNGMGLTAATDWIADLIPTATECSGEIDRTIFGHDFTFSPCEKLLPLREVLAWVFAVLSILHIVQITFRGQH